MVFNTHAAESETPGAHSRDASIDTPNDTPPKGSVESGTDTNEKQIQSIAHDSSDEDDSSDGKFMHKVRRLAQHYKPWWVAAIWALITAYFIVSLALKLKTQASDILPLIFLYVFISGRVLFYYVPTEPITRRIESAWTRVSDTAVQRIPARIRYIIGAAALLVIVLSVSLGLPTRQGESRLARMQSFLGIIVITGLMVATSKHRRHINWRTVVVGYLLQFCLGCIVMKTQWGSDLFTWLANIASGFLAFSRFGAGLLFGQKALDSGAIAVTMFPVIIFFASFVQMMYYLGAVQWLLKRMGWFFYKVLDTSGAEAIVASASPFIGQSENVLLVKDYIDTMTKSEIHACMTAGFATISGSVFQAYVGLGVNAKNLITACIMSIPCSLALSKIRYPERDQPLTRGHVVISKRTREANILHAMGNGAATGINLSLLILATIIGMVSLIYAINFLLTWLGQFIGIPDLTLEMILGYVFYPLAWLLGVPGKDVFNVSRLLGLKLVSNEFVAYSQLTGAGGGPNIQSELSARGLLIAEFSLAGFANSGSVAQVIAAIGSLAPARKADVSRLALSACLTGAISTMMTAAIVSMIV
ncbi:NupC family nucleoside cotransporter [Martensiomyces pterosporus]|nr:NupC family nucleoside cotransporter [Martensiomyces pterosporus]